MGNKSLAPNSVKLRFMRLVNDAGVLFKLNQHGAGLEHLYFKRQVGYLANGEIPTTKFMSFGGKHQTVVIILLLICKLVTL